MQNLHSLFRSRAIPLSFSNASVSANRSAPLSALSWPSIVFLPSRLSGGFLPSRLSGGPCHISSDRHLLSKKYKVCCGKSRFGIFSCPSSLPDLRAASELNRSMVICILRSRAFFFWLAKTKLYCILTYFVISILSKMCSDVLLYL